MNFHLLDCYLFSETRYHYVAQYGLKLMILLLQFSKHLGYRYMIPYLSQI